MPAVKRKADDIDRREIFDIICFYMGQGDCSLIRCPGGQIIMVDCGSKAGFTSDDIRKIVYDQVRHPDWAGTNSKIDALILTHKDADHYDKVGFVLGNPTISVGGIPKTYKQLTIDQVYFSWAYADSSPLGRYFTAGLGATVCTSYFSTSTLHEVTINNADNDKNFCKEWSKADSFKSVVATVPILGHKQTLFKGTTLKGKTWEASIIAGNVLVKDGDLTNLGKDENGYPFREGSNEDNSRSLITLLEIDGKKALFCGDATFSTESFLVGTQSAYIKDAQFILIPHHGSEWASSTGFVNLVKAPQVAVSCAHLEHKHRHPRGVSIIRWLGKAGHDEAHVIDYWNIDEQKAVDTQKDWDTRMLAYKTSKSKNFCWLEPVPGVDIDCALKMWSGVIYHAQISRRLWQTAASQIDPKQPPFLSFQIGEVGS